MEIESKFNTLLMTNPLHKNSNVELVPLQPPYYLLSALYLLTI